MQNSILTHIHDYVEELNLFNSTVKSAVIVHMSAVGPYSITLNEGYTDEEKQKFFNTCDNLHTDEVAYHSTHLLTHDNKYVQFKCENLPDDMSVYFEDRDKYALME